MKSEIYKNCSRNIISNAIKNILEQDEQDEN